MERVKTLALDNVSFYVTTVKTPEPELTALSKSFKAGRIVEILQHMTDPRLGLISFASPTGARKYYAVDKRHWIWCTYSKLNPHLRCYHEHFLEGRPTRLVMDFEIKGLADMTQMERDDKVRLFGTFKTYIIDTIIILMKNCWSVVINREDFIPITATDPAVKLSEHIVLGGGIYFKCMTSMRQFIFIALQRVFASGSEEMQQAAHDMVLDTQIYKVNGSLKLIYSGNNGDVNPKRVLRPVNGNQVFDGLLVESSMAQFGVPKIILEIDAPPRYFEKSTIAIEVDKFGSGRSGFGERFDTIDLTLDEQDKLDLEAMLNKFQDLWVIHPPTGQIRPDISNPQLRMPYEIMYPSIKVEDRKLILKPKACYCPIKRGYHSSGVQTFYFLATSVTVNCFSSECKSKKNFWAPLEIDDSELVERILNKYIDQ